MQTEHSIDIKKIPEKGFRPMMIAITIGARWKSAIRREGVIWNRVLKKISEEGIRSMMIAMASEKWKSMSGRGSVKWNGVKKDVKLTEAVMTDLKELATGNLLDK